LVSNIEDPFDPKLNMTKINDLVKESPNRNFCYLDEAKKDHNCIMSMNLSNNCAKNCFWCRTSFTTIPIGCPLEYVSSEISKKYFSEITKDELVIKSQISKNKLDILKKIQDFPQEYQIKIDKKDYFETDGIFCSFNCCLAFIKDNKQNFLYDSSESLLYLMFNKIFETDINIIPAPHWRLLDVYGGHIPIEEFRKNFNKIEFIDLQNFTKTLPGNKPIHFLFEEKVKMV